MNDIEKKSDKFNVLQRFRCSNSALYLRRYRDCRNSFNAEFRQKECDYQSSYRQLLDNPSSL